MNIKTINTKNTGKFLLNNAIIVLLVIMVFYVSITRGNFLSWGNFINVASNVAVRVIIAFGISGCLITKGTDLSAGRITGFAACIAATLLQKADYSGKVLADVGDVNILVALLLTVGICCIFGLVNGIVIAKLKVPPFIATLGMQTIVYGICLVYTGASPIGGLRSDFTNVATNRFLGIPILAYIALVIGLLMWFLYTRTRQGKFMYAIGGNEVAAEVSGINVSRTKIIIYTLAAACYGLAGFLLAAKSGGASVNYGMGYELEAIAAATIGGVSTNGGVGRISGCLLGVLVFELLKSSMQFMGIDTSYQYIVQGVVIIVAVALDIRKYIAKK